MNIADWHRRYQMQAYPEPHNARMPSQPPTQAELLAAAKRLRAMLKMPRQDHRWLKERDE